MTQAPGMYDGDRLNRIEANLERASQMLMVVARKQDYNDLCFSRSRTRTPGYRTRRVLPEGSGSGDRRGEGCSLAGIPGRNSRRRHQGRGRRYYAASLTPLATQ